MIFKDFCARAYVIVSFFVWTINEITSADLGIESDIFESGQASSGVIRDKHKGSAFIVDAGHSGSNEDTVPLLRRFNNAIFGKVGGHTRLVGVLLSHSDGDHVKLLTRVLNSNSRALKDQNSILGQELTAYLGSPFLGYCAGCGKPCLDALIAVNAHIKPLSHVMTSKEAYEESQKKTMIGIKPRPYFMNVLIPEFSDPARQLALIIMVANSLYGGGSKFLGTTFAPGVLENATPIEGATVEESTVFREGTNNNGAVVKLTYKGKRIIFPGDINGDHCTDRLLVSVPRLDIAFLKTDVLIAAHHGADRERTNNAAWLLMSDAAYIIVSAGALEGNYIHPRFNSLLTMATILKCNKFYVASHIIQCGDPTGLSIMGCEKLMELFCLKAGSKVIERGGRWMQMNTHLPLYTTRTSSDVRIIITSTGILTVEES